MKLTIFKGILRSTVRDRLLTSINLLGMIAGLTAGILILSFALEEYAHDEFHQDADRIYRIDVITTSNGETRRWADSPLQLRDELEASYPSVETSTRVYPDFGVIRKNDVVEYHSFTYVDPQFLEIFSYRMLEGNRLTALDKPGAIVLTRSVADRYFPDGDAMGQALSVKLGKTFDEVTVTGIVEDPPSASSIQFSTLIPFQQALDTYVRPHLYERWRGQAATFTRLVRGADPARFTEKLSTLQDTYGEALLDGRESVTFSLRPLSDIYFDEAALTRGITQTSTPRTANALIGLALLIIVIAAANFTTLSIARSTRQNRSVGIRKVIGASRAEITGEYLTESILKTVVAAIIAIALADLLAGPFSSLAGSAVNPSILLEPKYVMALAGLVLAVGVVSGFYPAIHLSGIRPIGILHGRQLRRGTSRLIHAVVIVQFAATAMLLIAAWTMSKQVGHLNTFDTGLDAENVLVVEPNFTNSATVPALYSALKSSNSSAIQTVARSTGMIARSFGSIEISTDEGTKDADVFGVSAEYLDLLGIELSAGDRLNPARPNELLVNRPFLEALESSEEGALGMTIAGGYQVVGVMNDFYHHNVQNRLRPFAVYPITADRVGGYLVVKAHPERTSQAITTVRDAWKSIAPDVPFRYYWLDENLDQQAGSTARWNRVMRASTVFALFIACLGLFGLSSLAALRRTKEVGIRKVLGAGPVRVTALLVQETVFLALVAALVAIPVGWWIMNRWLQQFANRVTINPAELGLLATGLIVVAFATVSVQSLRTALRNPVDSLRHE